MLKPPHPAAVVGYLTAMLVNPHNHALDGGHASAVTGALVTVDGGATAVDLPTIVFHPP